MSRPEIVATTSGLYQFVGSGVVLGPGLDWVPRGSTPRLSTNSPARVCDH